MKRREYLGAVATVVGATAGCVSPDDSTMTEEEAKAQFDDVQKFESPDPEYDDIVRFVDEEAGVCLYAASFIGMKIGRGVGLTSVPLKDTELQSQEESTPTTTQTTDTRTESSTNTD